MKHFYKASIYETQAILYWILGVMILNLGTMKWLGWLSVAWGWFTFIYTVLYLAKHNKEIKYEFD